MKVLSFYSRVDIHALVKKVFPCRRDPLQPAYFTEFFPYRTLLIRVERGAQGISL